VVFSLLSLQNLLGYLFQVRQYQKVIRKWLGRGVLGVGQRRGFFGFGELLVLVYNSHEDKVITVQSMRGYSIFARFSEIPVFTGLSLEELRLKAAGKGKKSVLNQAVKAVEKHLRDSPPAVPKAAAKTKKRKRKSSGAFPKQ
jgi:DNA-binding transcriptional regulator of glucitol operon